MSDSLQTAAASHAFIDNAVHQLAKKDGQHHFACHLGFGGPHHVQMQVLGLRRFRDDHHLQVSVHAIYTIGKQEHECSSYKSIPHVFPSTGAGKAEPDAVFVLSDSVRTLIGEAIQAALKDVRQICSVCQRHVPGPGSWDEKARVCQSCQHASILVKFLPEQEQKSVSFGPFEQKSCAICLEAFTPTSHVGLNDGCDHVFHYQCLCSLTKPECPLCKAHIHRLKRISESEWLCFQCDNDEDEDMD